VTQRDADAFEVKVEFKCGWEDRHKSLNAVKEHFVRTIPSEPQVDIHEFNFPHDCKFERYRSNV